MENRKLKTFNVPAIANGTAITFTVKSKDPGDAHLLIADWLNEAIIDVDNIKEVIPVDDSLSKEFVAAIDDLFDALFGVAPTANDKACIENISGSIYNALREIAPQQVKEKWEARAKSAIETDKVTSTSASAPAKTTVPKKRKDITFKDIYDTVQPDCSDSFWGPGEKSYIVKLAKRKDSTVDDILRAMDLEPVEFDCSRIAKQLFS